MSETVTIPTKLVHQPTEDDLRELGSLEERESRTASLRIRFQDLASEWLRTRPHSSRTKDLVNHRAYQEIIRMGEEAVPFIIEDLEMAPEHWFFALIKITGKDVAAPEHAGNLRLMADDWIAWWKSRPPKK